MLAQNLRRAPSCFRSAPEVPVAVPTTPPALASLCPLLPPTPLRGPAPCSALPRLLLLRHPPGCCFRRAGSSAESCACCSTPALCSAACGRSPPGTERGAPHPAPRRAPPEPRASRSRGQTRRMPPSCRPRGEQTLSLRQGKPVGGRGARAGWVGAGGARKAQQPAVVSLRPPGTQRKSARRARAPSLARAFEVPGRAFARLS